MEKGLIDFQKEQPKVVQSNLFEPYRSFGYYSSSLPFKVFKSDRDLLLASSVGKGNAFYVYDTDKLSIVYMSKYIYSPILWIEPSEDGFIYTAHEDKRICKWKKMHLVVTFLGHENRILKFIVGGDFLFSLGEKGEFLIFNSRTGNIIK